MARARGQVAGRQRGSIDVLPSGAFRVRVYAGQDPVSKRRHDLVEIVPAGPDAERRAREVRDRLVRDIAERRNPRTATTLDQLLDRHLAQFDGAPNTLSLYRGHVRKHISPLLGQLKVGQLDAETLDSFYAELRRCRDHCSGRGVIDHRTSHSHECDDRCHPHQCKPLTATTVRHIHFILSGAFRRAVRWRWVATNPLAQAQPPALPKPNPRPPSADQAARILNAAWGDPDWATLLWVAMTTGARRGEICAIRWSWVNLDDGRETIWLQRAVRKSDEGWVEGDLKTHQQRRIALDPETAALLQDHRTRCRERAAALGITLDPESYVFGSTPDGSTFPTPDSITQRYNRLAARVHIDTTFHKLRHYSATELILGGVDVRTVAGRLGHGGGGTTTLRTYTAWIAEADQRAAIGLGAGMPARPAPRDVVRQARAEPRYPYERLAATLADRIEQGELSAGEPLPSAADLAATQGTSLSTARRAVALLKTWGLAIDGTSRPLVSVREEQLAEPPVTATPTAEYWTATLRGPDGRHFRSRVVKGSLTDPDGFRNHLLGIARIEDPDETDDGESWIGRYEMEIAPIHDSGGSPVVLRW